MINTAFYSCFHGLSALVGSNAEQLPSGYAPYFEFDPNAEKAILNADRLGYNNALPDPIYIYFNTKHFNKNDTTYALTL